MCTIAVNHIACNKHLPCRHRYLYNSMRLFLILRLCTCVYCDRCAQSRGTWRINVAWRHSAPVNKHQTLTFELQALHWEHCTKLCTVDWTLKCQLVGGSSWIRRRLCRSGICATPRLSKLWHFAKHCNFKLSVQFSVEYLVQNIFARVRCVVQQKSRL